jgi:uncharacterized protein (DUF2141 family)
MALCLFTAAALPPHPGRADAAEGRAGATPTRGDANQIRFHVDGLRNDRGLLRCALYDAPEQFLEPDPPRAASSPARDGVAECIFPAVPPGEYAVSALHDEDADGGLDRTLFGLPAEGYALSRDAQAHHVGRPEWKDARFHHGGGLTLLRASIHYRRSKR